MEKDPVAIAVRVAELAHAERFAELAELFATPLRAMVSADAVRAAWTSELDRIGPVVTVGTPLTLPAEGGVTPVSVPVTCERGEVVVHLSVGDDGLVHGLLLARPGEQADVWTPPSYADPERFTEREVVIGEGPLAVPGTLT
ncbi:hypothetical protein HII36_53475, partial [Nonomuraea sp. NN258]|nr:hypothetical protein [Nonomuraea antri]